MVSYNTSQTPESREVIALGLSTPGIFHPYILVRLYQIALNEPLPIQLANFQVRWGLISF